MNFCCWIRGGKKIRDQHIGSATQLSGILWGHRYGTISTPDVNEEKLAVFYDEKVSLPDVDTPKMSAYRMLMAKSFFPRL